MKLAPRLWSEPPAASVTLNMNNSSSLQSIYCAISQRSACLLLTEKPLSSTDEVKLLSLDSGDKTLYHVKLSGSCVVVNVWAEDPQQAKIRAQEAVEKAKQASYQHESQLATILWELDRASSLLLTRAPARQVYQLIADARERIILTLGFHPVTLQMAEALHQLTVNQDEPLDPQTAKLIMQKIFTWKKQI
ncbi:MAG: hypothetical protein QXZ06_08695 [Candidatus Jordarchaeales archaeon]